MTDLTSSQADRLYACMYVCMCVRMHAVCVYVCTLSLSVQAIPQHDFKVLEKMLASNKKFKWISNRIASHWTGWVAGHKIRMMEVPASFTRRNVSVEMGGLYCVLLAWTLYWPHGSAIAKCHFGEKMSVHLMEPTYIHKLFIVVVFNGTTTLQELLSEALLMVH